MGKIEETYSGKNLQNKVKKLGGKTLWQKSTKHYLEIKIKNIKKIEAKNHTTKVYQEFWIKKMIETKKFRSKIQRNKIQTKKKFVMISLVPE